MLNLALPPLYGLGRTRRFKPAPHAADTVGELGIGVLLLAGAIAAVAVVAFSPALRIPGHAILRAALPMVFGMAVVPRRMSGSIMAAGAATAVALFSTAGWGNWQPAAVVSLLAFGPAMDLCLPVRRGPDGWFTCGLQWPACWPTRRRSCSEGGFRSSASMHRGLMPSPDSTRECFSRSPPAGPSPVWWPRWYAFGPRRNHTRRHRRRR